VVVWGKVGAVAAALWFLRLGRRHKATSFQQRRDMAYGRAPVGLGVVLDIEVES